MSIWIGVDPGQKGGMSAIYNDNGIQKVAVAAWDNMLFVCFCKSFKEVADDRGEQCVAAVEKVGAMHGQGVTSMFNFGKNAGYIEGVLSALNISYQLVPPKKWKDMFSLNSDKAKSIEVCKRLFPDVSLRRTERCTTDSDGIAESCLIAEWCRRTMK